MTDQEHPVFKGTLTLHGTVNGEDKTIAAIIVDPEEWKEYNALLSGVIEGSEKLQNQHEAFYHMFDSIKTLCEAYEELEQRVKVLEDDERFYGCME